MRKVTTALVGLGTTASLVGGAAVAFGATSTPRLPVGQYSNGSIEACVQTASPYALRAHTGTLTANCPSGYQLLTWSATGSNGSAGATGATGVAGAKGDTGPVGPAGAKGDPGTAGSDATLTVSGVTNITAWPESGGWATDAFARTVSVTRQHAANSTNCGGTPECWFYTFNLSDNGTFATIPGTASPNGTGAKIAGVNQGTMVGAAKGSFYASSGTPDGSLVPISANASPKPASTTAWATLAFPASVKTSDVKLTGYSWTYNVAGTCEQWKDQINPGDDGQSAADGNIAGVSQCV